MSFKLASYYILCPYVLFFSFFVSMCVSVCVYECECVVLFVHCSVFVFVCLLDGVLEIICSGPKAYPE